MRQTWTGLFVHLVWGTWDRLPMLTEELKTPVYRAIGAKCTELRAELVAVGGMEDHVHLLVQLPSTLCVADLVKHVKGASAHLVTHQLAPAQPFKWQGAYAAFTVCPHHVTRVRDYIARQREHHAAGFLVTEWEYEPGSERTVHSDHA